MSAPSFRRAFLAGIGNACRKRRVLIMPLIVPNITDNGHYWGLYLLFGKAPGEQPGALATLRLIQKTFQDSDISELKAAADRLASALADVDEEELVADFKELRHRGKGASR
jgi:hypothetical protein